MIELLKGVLKHSTGERNHLEIFSQTTRIRKVIDVSRFSNLLKLIGNASGAYLVVIKLKNTSSIAILTSCVIEKTKILLLRGEPQIVFIFANPQEYSVLTPNVVRFLHFHEECFVALSPSQGNDWEYCFHL